MIFCDHIATSNITVNISSTEEINIYNATGSLVLQQKISGTQEIDVQELESGFYYYSIGEKTGKLVIE